VPGVVGLAIEIYIISSHNFNSAVLPFFGFFSTIWIMFQLQSWRNREQTLALQWGTLLDNRHLEDRLEFYGDVVLSYVDGSSMLYYPKRKQDDLIYANIYRMVALLTVVVGLVVCIYVTRARLQAVVGGSVSHGMAAVWNSLQITSLNYVIRHVSEVLTSRENHRTDILHEESVVKKMVVLQSINSYSSLIYIAFLAKYVDQCPSDGCMSVVALNILVVFLTSIVINALVEVISYRWSLYHRKADYYDIFSDNTPSTPEKEYLMLPYSRSTDLVTHQYARLSVLFGYMALFSTAVPASAVLFMIALLVELHVDAWRILLWFQRPFNTADAMHHDIGSWSQVLWILSASSIITNAAIMSFTMNSFDHLDDSMRYWIFILFQWVGLIVLIRLRLRFGDDNQRSSSSHCDNSLPTAVSIQVARTAFIVRQLIDQVRDDIEWTTSKNTAIGPLKEDVDVTIHDSYDGLLPR